MTEKDLENDQEFEKKLRSRMNELSDSVDCFDKISGRVFREEESDFSDSEFVVTDLENITGRKRFSPLIKAAAAGLAAVIAISVVPKTGFYSKIMCNIGEHEDNTFNTTVSSVLDATDKESDMEFHIYDVGLDEYIREDVLVTPLYSCPFEDIGRGNVRVRVFVRSYNDILTNEIYAVEYNGDYKESNFIAVAETKAKFTEEELQKAYYGILELQEKNEIADSPDVFDLEGVSLSFTHFSIFKAVDAVYPMASIVKYRHSDAENYEYGIRSDVLRDGEATEYGIIPRDVKWESSVYTDGTSALPTESASLFKKEDYSAPTDNICGGTIYTPYSSIDTTREYSKLNTITLMPSGKQSFAVPVDTSDLRTLSIIVSSATLVHDFLNEASDSIYAEQGDPHYYIKSSEPSLEVELKDDNAMKFVVSSSFGHDCEGTLSFNDNIYPETEKAIPEAEVNITTETESDAGEAEQKVHGVILKTNGDNQSMYVFNTEP